MVSFTLDTPHSPKTLQQDTASKGGTVFLAKSYCFARGGVLRLKTKTLHMKKLFSFVIGAAMFVPMVASAQGLTGAQAGAILALLNAFGVDQATIAIVEGELNVDNSVASTVQVSENKSTTDSVSQVSSVTPQVPTPWVAIKVNNQDNSNGPVVVLPSGCIVNFVSSCAKVTVTWQSQGTVTPGCGILGGGSWSGNFGTSGSREDSLSALTSKSFTYTIQCNTQNGPITASVSVVIDTTQMLQKLIDRDGGCRLNPIPIGELDAKCAPFEQEIQTLEGLNSLQ